MRHILTFIVILFTLASCNEIGNKTNLLEENITSNSSEDSIGGISLKTLRDSGLIVEPYIYKITKTIEKEFDEFVIPIKICASFAKDEFGRVDSLIVTYNEKKHFIYLSADDLFMSQPNLMLSMKNFIKLDDYNFDNHPDIAVYSTQSGMKNVMENIYIYDNQKNRYFFNKILSNISNCSIDKENKTISTFGQGGMASMIYGSIIYKWENDKLVEIKNVNQDYIDSLNVFVKKTRVLVDAIWTTKIDTLTEDQAREWK